MRPLCALLLVAGAGCAQIFGLKTGEDVDAGSDAAVDAPAGDAAPCQIAATQDIDGDCVIDSDDPCIAPASDQMADQDGDGLRGSDDPCSFDAPSNGATDDDGDGIPDVCDPFPTMDKVRCQMAFTSTTVSNALWTAVSPLRPWGIVPTELVATPTATETVASLTTVSTEAPLGTTTYDALFEVNPKGMAATFGLYARVGGASDVLGCLVDIEGNATTSLDYVGPSGHVVPSTGKLMLHAPLPPTFELRIRVSISVSSGVSTVTCHASTNTNDAAHDGPLDVPPTTDPVVDGTLGISMTGPSWTGHLKGIEVFQQ